MTIWEASQTIWEASRSRIEGIEGHMEDLNCKLKVLTHDGEHMFDSLVASLDNIIANIKRRRVSQKVSCLVIMRIPQLYSFASDKFLKLFTWYISLYSEAYKMTRL